MSVSIHPLADVRSSQIGDGTTVWQFCVVLKGATIGRDCNICAQCFIENDVVVGDNVTVKCGVQLWDGLRVGNNVFIGPNATFTNDRHPSKVTKEWTMLPTVVEDDVTIGANATILPGLTLGKGCFVGAGAVVTQSVPPGVTVVGNPAHVIPIK